MFFFYSWLKNVNFRVPTGPTQTKLATAGKAFGIWEKREGTFQFKIPQGTCKAEVTFAGTSSVH